MSTYQIEVLDTPRCIVAEAPHWDARTQSLYFIDGLTPELPIHRYDYQEKKTYSAKLIGAEKGRQVTFIIPIEGEPNHFAISMSSEVGVIEWDGTSSEAKLIRTILTLHPDNDGVINDAKVDCKGRLYFGTRYNSPILAEMFKHAKSKLFRCVKGENHIKMLDNIYISNGLTWNEVTNQFYYIDSVKRNVMVYDHDPNTGNIDNERLFIDFKSGDNIPNYIPDGMTVDKDGFVYVALFEASKIVKINPKTGKIELEIEMPVKQITSVAFGGPNLDILFATTAAWETDEKIPLPAGLVFKVTGVATGLPMNKARL